MQPKMLNLPVYTTITAQIYSPDGQFLAVGSDEGRLAIFKVLSILDKDSEKPSLIFQFEAASILDENSRFKGCINALKTLKDTLIVAISRPVTQEAAILAFRWKDLSLQRPKLIWNIEASSGLLPTDVNSIDLDPINEKIFIGGGVGTSSTEPMKDHSIRVLDLETRMEIVKPLLGHLGYLHGLQYCAESQNLASCGEDGTVRIWDYNRGKKANTTILEPFKEAGLQRPKLGKWLSDVSIQGQWLVTAGGPKPSIWHLRARSPTKISDFENEDSRPFYVAQFIKSEDQRVIFGGQFEKVYHYGLDGGLKAEVKTSASCIYSVESTSQDEYKMLSIAGSNSKIDLCTHNFSYADNFITFP